MEENTEFLPAESTERLDIDQYVRSEFVESLHAGPIPAPETLKAYAAIDSSYAERIFVMAERVNDAQIRASDADSALRDLQLRSDFQIQIIARFIAFCVALAYVILCAYITKYSVVSGSVIASLGLGTVLVAFFVSNRRVH